MDILIEKEFFEVFMEDYFNLSRPIELELFFMTYAGLKVHTDMEDSYIFSNPILKMLRTHNKSLHTKIDFVSKNNGDKFKNLIIAFCGSERENWVDKFEEDGGLYFDSSSYKESLSQILENHDTIYLNKVDSFKWSDILPFKNLPNTKTLIADNYILSDNKQMKNNAFPIIDQLSQSENKISIVTCTPSNLAYADTSIGYKNAQKKLLSKVSQEIKSIQSQVDKYTSALDIDANVQVIPFFKGILKPLHNFDLHDRRLITKYAVITVGKGFDLLPLKADKENDYKITIRTIFDKEAYDDLRNFRPLYTKYVIWYKERHNQETFLPF